MTDRTGFAVVFDLDGLLVDSEPAQVAAWAAFLAEHGRRLDPALLGEMFGLRIRDSARLVAERLRLAIPVDEVIGRREALFFASLPGSLLALPGARETVLDLRGRGVPLGLATSGHRRYVDLVLQALDLAGAFDAEVTGEEVERGKPAPDIYLAAAGQLGIAPSDCVALEDAPLGVASAKAAGMRCLAIPNALTRDLPGLDQADAILPSLATVVPWLIADGTLPAAPSGDESHIGPDERRHGSA